MSKLAIERSLGAVSRLRETIADFAAREQQLVRSIQSRHTAISRKFHQSADGETLEIRLSETASAFDAETERVRSVFEQRRSRVERLRAQETRALPKHAREAREAWLGDLQMRLQKAEHRRTDELKRTATALEDWTTKLTSEWSRLVALKKNARAAASGYWSFGRLLRQKGKRSAPADAVESIESSFAKLQADLGEAEKRLDVFRTFLLPRIFRFAPMPLLALAVVACAVLLGFRFGAAAVAWINALSLLLFAAFFFLHRLGHQKAKAAAAALTDALRRAGEAYDRCRQSSAANQERELQRVDDEFEAAHAQVAAQWNRAGEVEGQFFAEKRDKIDAQTTRLFARIAHFSRVKSEQLAQEGAARLAQMKEDATTRVTQLSTARELELSALSAEESAKWEALERDWKQALEPIFAEMADLESEASRRFPAWTSDVLENWKPCLEFAAETKFTELKVRVAELTQSMPRDPRLPLPARREFSLPLGLSFPGEGSLLFDTQESASASAAGALNNVALRLLATMPVGKVSFTIIDPLALGQNFAGLMHLADYEESLINRRIWTQQSQIEERLAELNEHIEKVIQMYLRTEYATISEYNAHAGSVAEKYHFLVLADFPAGFSETAARRLQSIAASGPRCGVFTLIHWDRRLPLPEGFVPEDLQKTSVVLRGERGGFSLDKLTNSAGVDLVLDAPPAAELAAELVHKIGKGSVDSNRVEVPFSQIAPPSGAMWSADTTGELRVAIGRTGATKLQQLAIGKGTRQHALLAGKTGSGKSTLFHVIITNLALWCSPEQVEFYLIDFKKGVEFKCYAEKRLPHARVVAIESDREFALSVLQRVDEELKRRGDLFRKLGAQDLGGYKRAGGKESIPRTLLIIDEFQEFFVEDDSVAQSASLLFDRIVRQGRAFGIHVLLGSQTLGGAYTLARATLGQMVIRIALQCNEADAYLIMDENNSAPRLLSRPGEGIYNDASGAIEGNSPFQVVWLADAERDSWLDQVRTLADERGVKQAAPIVFEGNSPADVRDNELLQRLLRTESARMPEPARCWLGAPNSIKGPTEATFHRQSGSNLLVVGQREEAAASMLALSLLALVAQYPTGTARFVFFQSANADSAEARVVERLAGTLPQQISMIRSHDAAAAIDTLAAELKSRMAGDDRSESAPAIFVFIHGLHKFKKLRLDEEFSFSMGSEEATASAGAQFAELMTEGSAHGIHLLASVDTFNNVGRFISRKALSEWEMRVVFQMSANDSASLVDSPQAANLGLHRALFYNEREGVIETFRPYATPDADWLQAAVAQLARVAKVSAPASALSSPLSK
ncbi:MAG: segregation ATPase FtsK/SpoIIIE, family [Chthoniobacter sp.]|nr:segregation ATPase FtsK/SpoIIIE, family [Chthoniobacter sp.]